MSSNITNTPTWYVATKLQPLIIRSDIIRRPLIEEELCHFVSTLPLTLLSAPAGYGKTTLLSSLPSLLPDYPLAWISLDAEDNDPVRFIGLLATALQQIHPECGKSIWPLISGGEMSGNVMKQAMGLLINDIVFFLPDPFILVLDDLQFVTESIVYVGLDYLLDQLPNSLHMVIGTRHDPPLRLARQAARRQMGELRRSDFSLNQDETHILLNDTLGLELTDVEVAILYERTEGWPGVLCLLAGSLGRMSDLEDRSQLMTALNHTEMKALDFLSEEILLNLPEDIRLFLLQTSILTEITPSVCRAVTGRDDAAEVLAELYHRNLAIASISIDTKSEPVYRYHSLFAQLLTKQLELEMPGEIIELNRRAAEVQTTPGRAISHYFSAGLWDQAAQLMVNSGMQLLLRGMSETFRQWYDSLPTETRDRYIYLTVIMARCEIHHGDYTAARRLLNNAREAFVNNGDTVGEGGTLTSLITLSYESNDRIAATAYVKRAQELPLDPMGQVAVYIALAWLCTYDWDWEGARINIQKGLAIPSATGDRRADITGITYMSAPLASLPGCLELTENYCSEVSSLSGPETPWYLRAQELGTWPILLRGHIEEALEMAKSAEALRHMVGGHSYIGSDLPLLLSVIYLAKGDLISAEKSVATLIQRSDKSGRSRMMLHLHASGRCLALLGRYEEALIIQQRLETLLDDYFPLTQYLFLHLKGLLALLCKVPEAFDILQKALELEDQLPMAHVGGSARLLQARLFIDQGKFDLALAVAQPVLSKWCNSSTPGYSLFDGPIIIPVLGLAVEHKIVGAQQMRNLFKKDNFSNKVDNVKFENKIIKEQLQSPLTPREYEVLKLLEAGLTNIQISEELYVSKETVKTHIDHLFNKLDVHSRAQAVIRAHELDI